MSDWGRIAGFYDLQLWLERAALEAAIDLAAIEADDRVLDLGTGSAALLRRLGRRRIVFGQAMGIDSSPQMLARAPALTDRCELLEADATELPFPSESFDVIFATYLLHLLDRQERAAVLAEARRVMRPAGRLVVVTVAAPRSSVARLALAPVASLVRRRSSTLLGLRPLDPSPVLEESGFVVRQARRIAWGYPSTVALAQLAESGRSRDELTE